MKTYSRVNKVDSLKLPNKYLNSCRLCLTNLLDCISVDIFTFDKNKIKFCIGLNVSDNDGLPTKLCEICYNKLINFSLFKKICISNEIKLQKYNKVANKAVNTLRELNIRTDDDCEIKDLGPANVLDDKNGSLNDEMLCVSDGCNSVSFLLEEENVHPDAPNEVILQIKKDNTDSDVLNTEINDTELKDNETAKKTTEEQLQSVNLSKDFTPHRSYTCRKCKKKFYRTDALIRHEKKVHNISRLYCSYCSKSFISKSLIERHMRTHTGDKPFQCSVCSKTFTQKESMNRHYAHVHGEKKYECKTCKKTFTSIDRLKSHTFTQHTERMKNDIYRYKCKYCTKSFCHSSGLSRHLHTHTGVLFTCKVCQKVFSDGSCLRRHVLMVHHR